MKKRILRFVIDDEEKEISYTDIPINNPLTPSVLLYDLNDQVQIIEE